MRDLAGTRFGGFCVNLFADFPALAGILSGSNARIRCNGKLCGRAHIKGRAMAGDDRAPAGADPGTTGRCRLRRLFALALLIALTPVLSGYTVKGVKIERDYYRIYGKSHGELLKSVRRHGPRAGRAYGLGIIDFFPDYQVRRVEATCRVTEATVGLRVQLKLPQWQGESGTPRSVLRLARRFERVIIAHEMQHVAIAKRYARLMAQRLKKLPAEESCWTLRSKAREAIALLKRQHIAAQKRFDNRTRRQIKRLL